MSACVPVPIWLLSFHLIAATMYVAVSEGRYNPN